MTEHKWETEEINGGHVGIADFWKCAQCGAAGGPVFYSDKKPRLNPFLANGSGLELTQNCEESKRLIAAFELGIRRGKNENEAVLDRLMKTIKKWSKKK